MGKIMKSDKIVLALSGRYADRKTITKNNFENGSSDKQHGHALITGIDRYPRKVHKRMGKVKIHRHFKIKTFVKVLNYNHLMPTVDLTNETKVTMKGLKEPMTCKKIRFQTGVNQVQV